MKGSTKMVDSWNKGKGWRESLEDGLYQQQIAKREDAQRERMAGYEAREKRKSDLEDARKAKRENALAKADAAVLKAEQARSDAEVVVAAACARRTPASSTVSVFTVSVVFLVASVSRSSPSSVSDEPASRVSSSF